MLDAFVWRRALRFGHVRSVLPNAFLSLLTLLVAAAAAVALRCVAGCRHLWFRAMLALRGRHWVRCCCHYTSARLCTMRLCRSLRCCGWVLIVFPPALVVFAVAAVSTVLRFTAFAVEAVSACVEAGCAGLRSAAVWYRPQELDHRGSCCWLLVTT